MTQVIRVRLHQHWEHLTPAHFAIHDGKNSGVEDRDRAGLGCCDDAADDAADHPDRRQHRRQGGEEGAADCRVARCTPAP